MLRGHPSFKENTVKPFGVLNAGWKGAITIPITQKPVNKLIKQEKMPNHVAFYISATQGPLIRASDAIP